MHARDEVQAAEIVSASLHAVLGTRAPLRSDTRLEALGWQPGAWPVLVVDIGAEARSRGLRCELLDEHLMAVATYGDLVRAAASVLAPGRSS